MTGTIGFVGLGAMGLPMATNLAKAGHHVLGFDVDANRVAMARTNGIAPVSSVTDAAKGVDVLITMLPTSAAVRRALLAGDGALEVLERGSIVIDCSTTDLAVSREIAGVAADRGIDFLDAPATGTVSAATDGLLLFLVGGSSQAVKAAEFAFTVMGIKALHCGDGGAGQVAWACNQLVFASNLVAVSEALVLAERSGLPAQNLFEVLSVSSGNSWVLNNFCPLPGLAGFAPANYEYKPRMSAAVLAGHLRAAESAADLANMQPRVAAAAQYVVEQLAASAPGLDCSAVIKVVEAPDVAFPVY